MPKHKQNKMFLPADKPQKCRDLWHCNRSRFGKLNGGLGRIRTPDPLIRSQVLYPTELPVRVRVGAMYPHRLTMARAEMKVFTLRVQKV